MVIVYFIPSVPIKMTVADNIMTPAHIIDYRGVDKHLSLLII